MQVNPSGLTPCIRHIGYNVHTLYSSHDYLQAPRAKRTCLGRSRSRLKSNSTSCSRPSIGACIASLTISRFAPCRLATLSSATRSSANLDPEAVVASASCRSRSGACPERDGFSASTPAISRGGSCRARGS